MIEIDGSIGEGGGQILRTSLSLALVTGRTVRIRHIRAGRQKPGLQRQHLVCVEAAREIGDAEVDGAALGSQELTFVPRALRAGAYRFKIGTAGSTTLVLQTVLPALLRAEGSSEVTIEGGTHNPLAPPFDFLARSFVPLLTKMGANVEVALRRAGFFPAGGGALCAAIEPSALAPLHLEPATDRRVVAAHAFVANLPLSIAERELAVVKSRLAIDPVACRVEATRAAASAGNCVSIDVDAGTHTEVFTALGERGKSAERVANEAVDAARAYLASSASVSEFLADQLLLPIALAGGGSFWTAEPTSHATTNAAVIARFLPVKIDFTRDGERVCCRVGPRTGADESG
jgi:RNA 3'-terminal phosphate cyclase (ATP)